MDGGWNSRGDGLVTLKKTLISDATLYIENFKLSLLDS